MSCERHNGIVAVVERAIVRGDSAGIERVVNRSRWSMDDKPVDINTTNHRITYFDSTDWQAGGKNPHREEIEKRAEYLKGTFRLIDIP